MMNLKQRMAFHDSLRHGGAIATNHQRFRSALSNLQWRLEDNAEAVAALAQILAPEAEDLPSTYDAATDRLNRLERDIVNAITETDQECRASMMSLKDRRDTAAERRIEIIAERERLKKRGAPDETIKKREQMMLAGVPAAEVDRLVPLASSEELRAELDALDEEDKRLGLFLEKMDPGHLPDGFDEQVKARLEFRASLKTLKTRWTTQ